MIQKCTRKLLVTSSSRDASMSDSQSDQSSNACGRFDDQSDASVSAAGQEVEFAVETLAVLIRREMKREHDVGVEASPVKHGRSQSRRGAASPRKVDVNGAATTEHSARTGKVRSLQKQFDFNSRTKPGNGDS